MDILTVLHVKTDFYLVGDFKCNRYKHTTFKFRNQKQKKWADHIIIMCVKGVMKRLLQLKQMDNVTINT